MASLPAQDLPPGLLLVGILLTQNVHDWIKGYDATAVVSLDAPMR